MADGQVLIGTSGYDYPEWKGIFYPADLPRKEFLRYYAIQFNALELNNTFYSMPDAERMASFVDRTEGSLQFSVKANRLLTHEVPENWLSVAETFQNALAPMKEARVLSALLFQLPQGFRYTKENRIYLAELIKAFQEYPVVVEFRHREWIRESVFKGLVERNASVAFCDMPDLKSLPSAGASDQHSIHKIYTQFIGPQAYIRLHGRNAGAWYNHDPAENGSARYDYDYSAAELRDFVPVVEAAQKEGRKVHVFFNNHPKGSGAKNAKDMKDMLQSHSTSAGRQGAD